MWYTHSLVSEWGKRFFFCSNVFETTNKSRQQRFISSGNLSFSQQKIRWYIERTDFQVDEAIFAWKMCINFDWTPFENGKKNKPANANWLKEFACACSNKNHRIDDISIHILLFDCDRSKIVWVPKKKKTQFQVIFPKCQFFKIFPELSTKYHWITFETAKKKSNQLTRWLANRAGAIQWNCLLNALHSILGLLLSTFHSKYSKLLILCLSKPGHSIAVSIITCAVIKFHLFHTHKSFSSVFIHMRSGPFGAQFDIISEIACKPICDACKSAHCTVFGMTKHINLNH